MGTPSVPTGMVSKAKSRGLYAVLITLALLATAGQAMVSDVERMPPAMMLLVLVGPFGAIWVRSSFGNVAYVLSLATLLGFWVSHPATSPAEVAARYNLLAVTFIAQLFVFGYASAFRQLQRRNVEQQQRIEQRLTERAELTRSVSADLNRSVARLGEELRSAEHTASRIAPLQEQLERMMDRARQSLHFRKEPDIEVTSVLPDFRRRMTRWLFVFSIALVAITVIRLAITGRGPLLQTSIALAIDVAAFLVSEWSPERRVLCVAVLTTTAFIAITTSLRFWGFRAPPPNLLFLATLGYNGFLMGGKRAITFGVVGVALATQLIVGALGAASSIYGALMVGATMVVTVLLLMCWVLLDQRVLAIFATAQERAVELKQLDGFRARISGTLFHDVSNLVQVIGMTLQLGKARGSLSLQDIDTLQRFHERLEALVKAALKLLEHGELASVQRIASAPVAPIFEELRELFQFRLASKHQVLSTKSEAELRVLTVSELLRDSILANLISNAIKFSPDGGTIALTAKRDGGEAEIVVLDQGPGFPAALIAKLTAGQRVDSTAGTAGEQGLGLGLTLAAEHMRRIGGDLKLRTAETGGGEATLRLLAAE